MEKKQKNYFIALMAAGIVLVLIFVSVWYDTLKTVTTEKEEKAGQAGSGTVLKVGNPFHVDMVFEGGFPETLSNGVPFLTVTVANRSTAVAYLQLEKVILRKTDFIVEDKLKASVVSTQEVKPYLLTSREADEVMIRVGQSTDLTFSVSEYFLLHPGEFDISVEFMPGAFKAGIWTNKTPVSQAERIKVTSGISYPTMVSENKSPGMKPVAYVNDDPISEEEFISQLKEIYGWELLQKLIAEKVVREELKKKNIRVAPEDIRYALEFEKRVFSEKAPDVPFDEYLRTKGMTEDELSASKGFLLRIAIRKYFRELTDEPDEKELMKFFSTKYHWYGREEMVRAKKIVVRPETKGGKVSPAKAREDALMTLLTIRREIVEGRLTFDKAVEGMSQDVRARVSGGTMDPFRAYKDDEGRVNDVPRSVADAGFRLKPGEISTPLEGEEGEFMIIKVIDRIPEKKVLFSDVRDKVREDYMYDSVTGEKIQNWIQGLLKTCTVKVTREYNEIFSRERTLEHLRHFENELIKKE